MPFPSPAGAAASVSSRIGPCRKNSGPNEREPRRIVRRAEDRPARSPCDGSHSRTVREAGRSLRTAYRRPEIFSRWNRLGRKSELRRSSHNGTRQKSAVRNRPIVGPPERYRPTKSAAAYLQETVRNSRTRRAQRFSLHGRRQPIIGQNPPRDKNRNRVKN